MWQNVPLRTFSSMWNGAPSDILALVLLVPAGIIAVALVLGLRRRRNALAAARAWTEPLDLATLRSRMRIVEPATETPHLPQTRELLDQLHRQATGDAPRASGVAGSSRRR